MENSSIIIYQTENGNTKIEIRLEDETMSSLLKKSEIQIFLPSILITTMLM